jgi:hypothetical protein
MKFTFPMYDKILDVYSNFFLINPTKNDQIGPLWVEP